MEWGDIRNNVADYFGAAGLVRGLGPDDILKLSTNGKITYVGPIDWTWGKDDKEISTKLAAVETLYILRCNQVDALIHEAGLLIERALGDVLKYDDLNVERFKILMEFLEYDRTQAQQGVEQKDNDFWNGLVNEADLAAQARSHLLDSSVAIVAAYTTAVTRYNEAAADAGRDGSDVARQNAGAGAWSTQAGSLQYQDQITASKLDSASHTARKSYETQARAHQIERQAITREIVGLKLNEMRQPGGALNYNDRMREVGDRALSDFLEVTARLNAIALGLAVFYAVADPTRQELDDDLKAARTRVEGAVKWLRKAANALARARMDEQECTIRLTVQPKGKDALLDALKAGLIIPFPADLVSKMTRPQLRGVSATAEALSGDAWVDCDLTSPEQVIAGGITLPSVAMRLGRVSSSASMNIRDVVGPRPIINRSPVGDWKLQVNREDRGKTINHLHLDFHLAFC